MKTEVKHKVLFSVRSGCSPWSMLNVEDDSITEDCLEDWAKDCVLHHTGRKLTDKEWEIFKTNRRLVRRDGKLTHEFSFDRYTIE